MKEQEMTQDDAVFMANLEALFAEEGAQEGAETPALPLELEIALKQQVHDRLQPETSSLGEILLAATAGVFVLAMVAGGTWGTEQMLVLVPTVVAYCAATLAFAGERGAVDG